MCAHMYIQLYMYVCEWEGRRQRACQEPTSSVDSVIICCGVKELQVKVHPLSKAMYMYIHVCTYMYVTGSGKLQNFEKIPSKLLYIRTLVSLKLTALRYLSSIMSKL